MGSESHHRDCKDKRGNTIFIVRGHPQNSAYFRKIYEFLIEPICGHSLCLFEEEINASCVHFNH